MHGLPQFSSSLAARYNTAASLNGRSAMPLNAEQTQKLMDWFGSKGISPLCPACDSKIWSVGDVITAPVQTASGTRMGGPVLPMIQLACGNCASMRLFAAKPIGLA